MMMSGETMRYARVVTVAALAMAVALWPAGARAQTAGEMGGQMSGQMDGKVAGEMAQPMAHATPKVGSKAPDFSLQSLDGATVRLSDEVARGPVVLVVLRGWPGYQCPFCTRQFGDYLANAARFATSGAQVLFVYPGPANGLKEHAEAFTSSTPLPSAFRILLDPDYVFTQSYGLRWDAPNETAYPSTFVLDRRAMVTFAHTSREHGDRVSASAALKAVSETRR
jgi:peroxiredoxin